MTFPAGLELKTWVHQLVGKNLILSEVIETNS